MILSLSDFELKRYHSILRILLRLIAPSVMARLIMPNFQQYLTFISLAGVRREPGYYVTFSTHPIAKHTKENQNREYLDLICCENTFGSYFLN